MPTNILRHPAAVTILFTVPAAIAGAGFVELTAGWLQRGAGMLPALIAAAIPALVVPLAVYPLARAKARLPDTARPR
jgi:hypothetical protein